MPTKKAPPKKRTSTKMARRGAKFMAMSKNNRLLWMAVNPVACYELLLAACASLVSQAE